MYFSFCVFHILQQAQIWHEMDIKLLNMTDDVDYDVEGQNFVCIL